MKRHSFLFLVLVFSLLAPSYAFCADLGWMRISLIEGDVQVKTPDAADWGLASINGPLMEGDQIWVPDGGRLELQLNGGSYVRLDQNSALQVLSLDRDSSQFYLSQGHAYIYFRAPGGNLIQIDTPDSSTRAFDRAIFRVDMSDQYQYTDVAVYKGYVETENQVGRTRINAGEMLSVGQDTDGEVAPMGAPDDWEEWNKDRNHRIFARRGASSRYLPPELSAYSYDFDTSGRWVDVPDYGYCWTPTLAVGVSWAPYRFGRWTWIGGDYVWISYDPWGWVPYHYGRWSYIVNIGWCWVPPAAGDVYWGPGYVGWVITGDYVSWVPLAPGEIYYGRGYYGRSSVNITNVNITRINITNVYKNVYVTNGVTVVNRRTFGTASPRIVSVNRNVLQQRIFTRSNIKAAVVTAPGVEIKPTRQSFLMSAKPVPSSKRPPQSVRDVQIKQLKQSRRLVKDPGKSVLNPGARPETLPLNKITTPKALGKGMPVIRQIKPTAPGKPAVPGASTLKRKPLAPAVGAPPPGAVRPEGPGVKPRPQGGRQIQPRERVRPEAPKETPAPRGREIQPRERVRPEAPKETPAPRGREIQPQERVRPGTPKGGEKRQPAEEKKKEPEKKSIPEKKKEIDEKKELPF
jgi:hypothetical protein